jgi:Cu(I)/Ag(I) efflux system periplasmic protein CusF
MKIRINTAIAAIAIVLSLPVRAAGSADMTDAEVRKVDKAGGKLTLKHAEIKSLDMPAMTMVFVVKDKAMLDKLQPGDKVKFKAVNEAGKYTVTEIQTSK